MNELDELYDSEWLERIRLDEEPSARVMCRTMKAQLQPGSMLDFGSGPGNHANIMHRLGGVEVVAVDGVTNAKDFLNHDIEFHRHDFRRRFDIGRVFDLVTCFEVIEHIDEAFERTVLANVVRHVGRWLCFSAAKPGQPGRNHVNLKPLPYWIERLEAKGLRHRDNMTSKLKREWRAAQPPVRYYFADNLAVFERRPA